MKRSTCTRAGPADAREVVAAEIDEHHVLGAVLLRGEQPLGVAGAGRGRAGDRVQAGAAALDLDQRLGRRADQGEVAELEQEQVRRRVDAPQRAVEVERARRRRPLGPLREHDLEGVARADVLLRRRPRSLVRAAAPAAAGSAPGCPAARRRERGRGRFEQRFAAPRRRRAAPPPARRRGRTGRASRRRRSRLSGRSGPSRRQRDGRLEHRGVVVARVADHGRVEAARPPSSDTRRAPQPTKEYRPRRPCSTDSSRNAASPVAAQPDVRPERGDQVGGDDGGVVHATKTTLRSEGRASGSEGSSVRPCGRPARGAATRPRCGTIELHHAEGTASGARFRAWPVP